jgi:uncharacterized protein (TIGR03790 family)
MKSAAIFVLVGWSLLLASVAARAGGSGLNVIVVVNQNSTNSVQLGNDYCELRGVPPQNFLRLTNWAGGNLSWSPADFTNDLLTPLLAMVKARGLTNQAQFVLLSMDIPYRVTDGYNGDSTTAALFYGFKTNDDPTLGTCSLPDNSSNSYAYSEMPFALKPPNTAATNSFLAMMLTDTNLAMAENTLRRSVAADFSAPTQMVYLAKTSDQLRNVRFVEFDNSIFENRVIGNFTLQRTNTDSTAFTNLAGLLTGLAAYSLGTNMFVPGAFGDTVTSFAGDILEGSGQTPLLAFLEAGAAASYGTVVEPCNYTQKFSDAEEFFYQSRGFTAAEAYYQSVLNPFEGLLVGEPLSAPFARPGGAMWTSPTNGTVISGTTNLTLNFTSAATNLPLVQVDLFVDGKFFAMMTNLPPAAGNILAVTLNGHVINLTVPTNANVAAIVTNLVANLNAQSNVTQVLALPFGDRIELQSLALMTAGSNITVSTGATIGSAPSLTTHLTAARPAFLDTVATGYQVVNVFDLNPLVIGDWISITLIKTNGTVISLAVTNTVSGTSTGTLSQNLVNLINATPALQTADGATAADFFDFTPYGDPVVQFIVYANTPGWRASQVLATLSCSTNLQTLPAGTNPLADNVNDLRPKNHLYVSSGSTSLTVNYPFNTATLADGAHELTAVGYEGTSVGTQTRATINVLVQNTGLTAVFNAQPGGTNVALGLPLQFTVTPNTTNIARIEIFGNGGSLGFVTNQPAANFSVPTTWLGLGLQPVYAVVTDQTGHVYQTSTLDYRVIPAITLTLNIPPTQLSWPALIGRQYSVQSATNLITGFQTLATTTATNTTMLWPVNATDRACFYRVILNP